VKREGLGDLALLEMRIERRGKNGGDAIVRSIGICDGQ
jgi:hypothetical protein